MDVLIRVQSIAISIFGSLLFLLSSTSYALPHLDPTLSEALTLEKGKGEVGLDIAFHHGTEYFNSSGNRQDVFADGTQEDYYDFFFLFGASYGLTNRLLIWLDFPLLYREETDSLNAEDYGLGDVRAGARYRFWRSFDEKYAWAVELSLKFPSGDSDLSMSDPAQGKKMHLPLGSGNSDLSLSLMAQQKFLPSLRLEEAVSYTFRFDALVEFLQTDLIGQTAPDGSILALPIGNLRLDWGDEVDLKTRILWEFWTRWSLALEGRFRYRRPSHMQDFIFADNGDTLEISRQTVELSSGYVLYLHPSLFWQVHPRILLRAGFELPVAGESFPTLPFVESLLGPRYELEIRYAF